MLEKIISIAMLTQTIRISIPYILAALGGVFSERSGVINIALEGIILNGAFSTVLGTYFLKNPYLGLICGICGGLFTATIHAIVSIRYKVDQIISGIAINLFAVGITKFFLKYFFGSSSNSPRIESITPIKFFPENNEFFNFINEIFGNPLILLTILLVVLSHIIMFKTPFGLRIRSVGEHPEAAETLGIKVNKLRFICVLISGILAGLGGVWLCFDQHQFTDSMSNGRGFIALAAVIFGKWTPIGATGACLLFGFAETIQITLQGLGTNIPTQFIQMIPYVFTMIALAGVIGRSTPPMAIGKPYEKD